MDSPLRQQRLERREFRYPLHLPVLVRMLQRDEMRARSENISLGGILLSSAFLIPEGVAVEVVVGVEHLADPGILLNARGRVLRVVPRTTGDFAVAILLDRSFQLPRAEPACPPQKKGEKGKKGKGPTVRPRLALTWDTET
jgi:hypothetical protein